MTSKEKQELFWNLILGNDRPKKRPKQEKASTSNPTVYNRLKRLELSCPHCKPNKGENSKCKKKHGVKKPKKKDKRT